VVPISTYYDDFGAGWGGLMGQLSGVPRKRRNSFEHILLLGLASPETSCHDMMRFHLEDLEILSSGFTVWHASLQQDVFVVGGMLNLIADMPQANDFCNVKAPNARHPCRFCCKDKELFGTQSAILQAEMRNREDTIQIMGGGQTFATTKGVLCNEKNPFFSPLYSKVDPHQMTAPELLHFWFLGVSKHGFLSTWEMLGQEDKEGLEAKIRSFIYPPNIEPLFNPKMFKLWQGKHWQTWSHLAVFFLASLDEDLSLEVPSF